MSKLNQEKLQELIDNTDYLKDCVDTPYLSTQDLEDETELSEALQECISGEEIVYYHKAMEYLIKEDASLNESLEIASSMGCDIQNLNSELLATIHYQQTLTEELSGLDLSECFEEVEENDE